MKNNKTKSLAADGVIWKQLFIFFLPIAAGTCIQQLYNTVDGLIVGRFVGTTALAAVGGSSAQIINLMIGFFVAATAGASVVIAQIFGAGRTEDVQKAAGNAITVFGVIGVLLAVIGFAARQDYRAFFESEFRRRRNGLYPPFTNLARLLIESPSEETADRIARELNTAARELLEDHPDWRRKILTLINDPPSVQFLRGKYRRQVLMKTLVSPETEAFFGELTAMLAAPFEGADVYLEVNPTTMI